MNTDLIVVGAGAAGLMAGAAAGERKLRAVVLERKHHPGRKLLLCGNNRCNVSQAGSGEEMLAAFGAPVADFLGPAISAFPPRALCRWFSRHGLRTVTHKDGRIFPAGEKADDVLHLFTDLLRKLTVPLILNCPVTAVTRLNGGGFRADAPGVTLEAPCLLLATGGVSYPKTGSVGDGQRFAKGLGHRIVPYRAGLVGFEFVERWLAPDADVSIPAAALQIHADGGVIGRTQGEILFGRRCARGPAMINASRVVARLQPREYSFVVDLFPVMSETELSAAITAQLQTSRPHTVDAAVSSRFLPAPLSAAFLKHVAEVDPDAPVPPDAAGLARRLAGALKGWRLKPRRPRPLKEAMVTVGGVDVAAVEAGTMASRLCPGLFFAGEVLDIDGPTGGYNLHAAFASARLAVQAVADRLQLGSRSR